MSAFLKAASEKLIQNLFVELFLESEIQVKHMYRNPFMFGFDLLHCEKISGASSSSPAFKQ